MTLNTGKANLLILAGFIGLAFAPELAAPFWIGSMAGAFAMWFDNYNA